MMASIHANAIPHPACGPTWPPEFKRRKVYNLKEENIPFVSWDKVNTGTFVIDCDNEGEEIEYEDVDDGEEEVSGTPRDTGNDQRDHPAATEENQIKGFMEGIDDNHQFLGFDTDQIDLVVKFYEHGSGNNADPVALIHDRNNGGDIHGQQNSQRPYLGPLSGDELHNELTKPRFNAQENVFDDSDVIDAYRRTIFIGGLNSSTVNAMASTASRTQAPVLRDMFLKHLTGKASMGVNIPSQGFRAFILHFNIPYYVLRQNEELIIDSRLISDNVPLRKSREFHTLSQINGSGKSTGIGNWLHEAHISFAVTGFDDNLWTAYAFVDSYFDTSDRVQTYHRMNGPMRGRVDPLTTGITDSGLLNPLPRQYFLRVVGIRLRQVVTEWTKILDRIYKDLERSRSSDDYIDITTADPQTQDTRKRTHNWASQKMKELRQFKPVIFNCIKALHEFQKYDIGYFQAEGALSMRVSLENINKLIMSLEEVGENILDIMDELSQNYPQGEHARMGFQNNEAQAHQQRSASHIQMLTYVTIAFIPLCMATSIFSMQGVLPFTPTLAHFAYVLVSLIAIVAITLATLLNWSISLGPRVQHIIEAVWALFLDIWGQLIGISAPLISQGRDVACEAIRRGQMIPQTIRQNLFPGWHRRNPDLEEGLEMDGP